MRHKFALLVSFLLWASNVNGQVIETVAGGGPNNLPATSANLNSPQSVAVDSAGNFYVAATNQNRVFKVSTSGTLTVVAGNGTSEFAGDGGPGPSAGLADPAGVGVDSAGNVFITDQGHHRIRRVDATTGLITTVAGTGDFGFSGDGSAATSAELAFPSGVAVDAAGNLFIADTINQRIRKVTPAGTITTVAGNGTFGFAGDGGAATNAQLANPGGLAVDAGGNLFIADTVNQRIRKVTPAGIITTVAGNGTFGFAGDGGAATNAHLANPTGVVADLSGNLFIADSNNERVRKVATDGTISTVAGDGTFGFSGDSGPATGAQLANPSGVAVDNLGRLLIADTANNRIRRVDSTGTISTVGGNGTFDFSGDGSPATDASLSFPLGVAFDAAGNLYIADISTHRVRRVDTQGIITTVAGNGVATGTIDGPGGNSDDDLGDGGPATAASLNSPAAVAVDSAGNILIADTLNNRIRRVSGLTGTISTVAGNGGSGFGGDGGAATDALLASPFGVTVDKANNIFIADSSNERIRRVNSLTGLITTVAGDGSFSFKGDGGPATSASLANPTSVAVDDDGNLFITDMVNQRIRKVDTANTISTVAGNGIADFNGDGGPATSASLNFPFGVVVDGSGNLSITDQANHRIRRVEAATGTITTVAGDGSFSFKGDGGPATSAGLAFPTGLAVSGAGSLFFADSFNSRIRRVGAAGGGGTPDSTPPVITPEVTGTLGNNGWYVSDVTISWSVTDAESTVSSTSGCETSTVASDTDGTIFTCTATSGGGTASQSVTIKRDATPPTISITTPAAGAVYLLNEVAAANYTCVDNLSGVATCVGPVASGSNLSTATVGSQDFTVNATDQAGNGAARTNSYSVEYNFIGFLPPIANLPMINTVTPGRTIPVKWQLRDAKGGFVSDLGSVRLLASGFFPCDATPAPAVNEQVDAAGRTALRFDAAANQFAINWQTDRTWSGCRLLRLLLTDGTDHYALFRFNGSEAVVREGSVGRRKPLVSPAAATGGKPTKVR